MENNTANKKKRRLNNPFRLSADSDLVIHLTLLFLAFFGTIMIGSATMGTAVGDSVSLAFNIVKQLIFVIAGYLIMAFASRKFKLSQLHGNMFSMCIILLYVLLLACLAFAAVNGAKAWIRIPIGSFEVTLQPSEFSKVATILVVAGHLGDRNRSKDEKSTLWSIIHRPVIICGIMSFIICVLQGDFGSMVIQFMLFCICYLIPRSEKLRRSQTILRILFYAAVIAAVYLLSPYGEEMIEKLPFLKDYQINRLLSAINPFEDAYGSGYQLIASLIAFSEGGIFGKGLGKSTRKYMSFPEANTDFILAIVVEELGLVGFIFLLALYAVIIFRLLYFARKMHSEAGRIVLVGTAMYFLLHIFFNVGGVTGLIPLTGIPLPLVSAGGSSAMAFMLAIGLSQAVISAYRRGDIR